MALKKIIEVNGESFIQLGFGTINTGIQQATFSALCKVTSIQGNKDRLQIVVTFQGEKLQYTQQYNFQPSVDENSTNFIKQAYIYLKTLPEFFGAEDC